MQCKTLWMLCTEMQKKRSFLLSHILPMWYSHTFFHTLLTSLVILVRLAINEHNADIFIHVLLVICYYTWIVVSLVDVLCTLMLRTPTLNMGRWLSIFSMHVLRCVTKAALVRHLLTWLSQSQRHRCNHTSQWLSQIAICTVSGSLPFLHPHRLVQQLYTVITLL